jgi:hypothetical protein
MAANTPARLDITIHKGAPFIKRIAVTNSDGTVRNLIGFTAKMQIRQDVDDLVEVLTVVPTIVAASGYVDIFLSKAQTAALTILSGVWDVWIDDGTPNSPEYLAQGGVVVQKMVTQ